MAEYVNLHGRRGTRGWRPWLLLPKVLAVAVYFGGLVTAAALWLMIRGQALANVNDRQVFDDPLLVPWRLDPLLKVVGGLFELVVVPALLLAAALGLALLWEHRRQFVRLRWWQVKMLSLAIGMPVSHFYLSSRIRLLQQAVESGSFPSGLCRQVTAGFAGILLFSVWIILLGRLKPRLGQNWGRDYAGSVGAGMGGNQESGIRNQKSESNEKLDSRNGATKTIVGAVLAAGLLLCSGCVASGPALPGTRMAPDFAFEFHVQGLPHPPGATTAPASDDPLRQTSQYVLEPNRKLRVAVGEGATSEYFPAVTRTLEPRDVEALYDQVSGYHLMAEPTSPLAEEALRNRAPTVVVYQVTIRAYGQTHVYSTTAAESPPTLQLLQQLVKLRQGHEP